MLLRLMDCSKQRLIYEADADTIGHLAYLAVGNGIDLTGADLACADMAGFNLAGAKLAGADLRRADLRRANLNGANLRNTTHGGMLLDYASLIGADLRGSYPATFHGAITLGLLFDWESHVIIAEILRRAAGSNVGRLKAAGLVAVTPDYCWGHYLHAANQKLVDWAVLVLKPHAEHAMAKGNRPPTMLLEAIEKAKSRQPAEKVAGPSDPLPA